MRDAVGETAAFHDLLRREVCGGNPHLSKQEQSRLQSHYEVMMQPSRYPAPLVTAIYVARRALVTFETGNLSSGRVLDAGCAYGSESFLFASRGASVLAVDASPESILIAQKRKPYFEAALGKELDVEFVEGSLESIPLARESIGMTWIASVLAAIEDQESLLQRIYRATRPGGSLSITDMNLLNPLFLSKEWRRRRRWRSPQPDGSMFDVFLRRNRRGARTIEAPDGSRFDDSQFFWSRTIRRVVRGAGFDIDRLDYSGFLPPACAWRSTIPLERAFAGVPFVRAMGYFYLIRAVKPSGHAAGEWPGT